MEINQDDRWAIDYFLIQAEGKGYNWVAFDFSNHNQMNYLQGFESASDAIDFCTASNIRFDYAEQNFIEANCQYLPIETFLETILPGRILESSSISSQELATLLKTHDVKVLESLGSDALMPLIQGGAIFPVQFNFQISPLEEIDRFIVVAHHHAGHQVYEIGHSIKTMDSFDSLDKAEQYFDSLIRQYPDNTDENDYQLIGLYRGQEYKADLDGTPENYSGLTLKAAYYQHSIALKAKVRQVHNNMTLDKPVNIQHFIYAQYDAENGRLKLLNDQLKETQLKDIKTSTYPSYFINEKFTFKNLSIMNESSYEFVKDQLFYLGFGSEIAAPLREKMEQNLAEFTLEHSKTFGKDETKNVLHFSKGDDAEKDLTFFNRVEMTLKQEGKEDLTQTFFVGQAYNYTLQERYNMLDGRAVYREQPKVEPVEENGQTRMKPTGETYLGWRALNFKEADKNGNFLTKTMFWNHAKELVKYPIKNINEAYDRSRILAPLERGDRVSVTLVRDGQETAAKVVANPKMTRLAFYDTNGQSINVRKVEKQAVDQTQKTDLTPQEVQQQAKAKAAQSQETGQQNGANQTSQPEQGGDTAERQQTGQQHSQQNEAKETIGDEQKAGRNQRRNQGTRV